jgi:AraC family transcriptional regulator of adaptative response/methylated-DNA-[protein]-cysteine methyltransferase
MEEERYWQAVLDRDATLDGAFVYAVRSTGIYCRPTCPSRRPRRAQVAFFAGPAEAEAAGYRPCRRCRPQAAGPAAEEAERMAAVCRYIETHLDERLTLAALGRAFGMGPTYLQRRFKAALGISPAQYAESCRLRRIRGQLADGDDIAGATYEAGYGSASRLYSKAGGELGMTPGEYRAGGAGLALAYALADCFLGRLLVASTPRGIAAVRLGDDDGTLISGLAQEFSAAELHRDDAALAGALNAILRHLEGAAVRPDLPLDVQATAFQRRVWAALREIPYGATRTYGQVAADIGRPRAARAGAAPAPPTPWPWWCPATAWYAVTAGAASTAGARAASRRCWPTNERCPPGSPRPADRPRRESCQGGPLA